VYDPQTDTWETRADMPQAQGGLAAAVLNGRLYAFGGEQWSPTQKVFSTVWVYDPATDSWDSAGELPEARHGLAAATIGSETFSIAGADRPGGGAVNSSAALTPGTSPDLLLRGLRDAALWRGHRAHHRRCGSREGGVLHQI